MIKDLSYRKLKKEYLSFVKSQEVLSEPFRDKEKQLKNFYIPIGEFIFNTYKKKTPLVIGLSGGQGSGKSTISKILKIVLKEKYKLRTVIFSIDDFYKTIEERQKMSIDVYKLFKTRGVPGTHDTKLLFDCITSLKKNIFKKTSIPKFDKSIDNRLPKNKWQIIKKKPDIIIFEGWCVGATPQREKNLLNPMNSLEKIEDKKKIWRSFVNNKLKKEYKKIFNLIDKLIFLKVPSFKKVYEWRLLQENKLKLKAKGKKIMEKKLIGKFIMFYERLTKHMLKTLDKKAHVILKLDGKHKLKSIKFN